MSDYYKGVFITNTYWYGHKNVVESQLRRSVAAIVRDDRRVSKFYIGVASGIDYWSALKSRIDDKKIAHGTTRMHLLYYSTSESNTRELEARLVDYFRERPIADRAPELWNAARGGGGRHGAGPQYFIYVATTDLPDL